MPQYPSPRPPNRHDLIVARSRALHRAVADRIRENRDLMEVARRNVDRWIAQEANLGPVTPGLLEWKMLLEERTADEILSLICEESEEADRLRQATPFCGVLTGEEREAIYRQYAAASA